MVNQDYLRSTYKDKKVFVTGHTGFKGSWLLSWLYELGAQVKGYSLEPINDFDMYHKIKGDLLCDSVIADIRDFDTLSKAINDFAPDFIFHLAAQALVRVSYSAPLDTFEINAQGTANVLEILRQLKHSCIGVFITTDKVYEIHESNLPYNELDRLGGYDPYSASKAAAELIISSYHRSFINSTSNYQYIKAVASVRAGNVLGGGDWAQDRIIPDIMRAFQRKEPLVIRNPKAVRPWQHVLEPLSGYLLLGAKLQEQPDKYSGAWNFGPKTEDTLTVSEIVDIATSQLGEISVKIQYLKNQPHESSYLSLNIDKSILELGWKPKWTTKEAIKFSIDWYLQQDEDIFDFTIKQIKSY